MNYRHAFHAGNFADVFKHILLTRLLAYLTRKDAPLRFIDTHAGIGAYDLAGSEATRSGEWRDGVARLRGVVSPPDVAALIAPYLEALGPLDAHGRPAVYPGSPLLAQRLLRAQDRIALCEAHPDDRALLVANMGRDARLSIVGVDGFVALGAYLPPKERRGLALIDPPYESPDEARRVEEALARAHRKWPTGTFALWRPIKDKIEDGRFLNSIAALGAPNILNLELSIGVLPLTPDGRRPLGACGMLVVNPPYTLIDEARVLLPWLATTLASDGRGAWVAKWLTPPA